MTWRGGQATWTGWLSLYYCRAGEQGVCLVERARISVPIEVVEGGTDTLEILYAVDSDRP